MKYLILPTLLAFVACNNTSAPIPVAYEVAQHYFFNASPADTTLTADSLAIDPKITSEETFNQRFGMAPVMGEGGAPTAVDFSKQFVLALVLPETNKATDITPTALETRGDTLLYTYKVNVGETRSFTTQPCALIVVDKAQAEKILILQKQ